MFQLVLCNLHSFYFYLYAFSYHHLPPLLRRRRLLLLLRSLISGSGSDFQRHVRIFLTTPSNLGQLHLGQYHSPSGASSNSGSKHTK
jgi:hypothetical protein